VAERLLAQLGCGPDVVTRKDHDLERSLRELETDPLAEQLGVGVPTLRDILDALVRPDRDPRDDLPKPVFKHGVLRLDDLEPGMELKGTVLNVVDFGVFVDIGLKDSGLIHISQLSTRYIKTPHEIAAVGDTVTVWVLGTDASRRRVSLTMIPPGTERRRQERKRPEKPSHRRERPKKAHLARRPPRKSRSEVPPPPLPQEVLEGAEPIRSFGQLKQLWESRIQQNGQ
jgi:uncharacterized protein